MKEETCDVSITFFVGLKTKMYTYITKDDPKSKKTNSVNNNVVDDELKYEDYENVVLNGSNVRHEMDRMRS